MSAATAHGVLAEFAGPAELVAAARRLSLNGFRRIDAFTPYPVEDLDEFLPSRGRAALPALIFAGGVIGAALGYFIQYWAEAVAYPLNVGGRPLDSWPAFTVSAFEAMVLFALTAGFLGLLLFCGLPRLWHPLFAAEDFPRASQDGFFLCVGASDPRFDRARVQWILEQYGARRISVVPGEEGAA